MFGIDLTILALFSMLVPFAGGLLIALTPQPAARAICIISGAISTILALMTWIGLSGSGSGSVHLTVMSLGGAEIAGFVVDKMSVMLATAFVGIGLLISIYSVGYLNQGNKEHPDRPRRRFYAWFTVFIGSMAGVVFSSTLFGQLVFFEITGLCSWALIGYYGTPKAEKYSYKALLITHIGSIGLVVAVGALFFQAGTSSITAIAGLDGFWKSLILIAVLISAWAKSAQLPFYMWLPTAMEAPTPVSAYLHGASMVKVGVAIMARLLVSAGVIPDVVGWVIVIGAILTLLFSFLMYLPQKDMKRLLAFSTISQISYIFLGFAFYVLGGFGGATGQDPSTAGQLAMDGSLMHMFNHAFAKTLFFLVAGAFSYTMGTRMLPQIRGLLSKKPFLAVCFAVAALAIAGVPPLNGFFSKFAIFSGGFTVAHGSWLLMLIVIVALVETLGCFAWFLKWIGSVLPGEPSEVVAESRPLPKVMVFVFVILLIMTVASSFIAASWLA